MLIDMNNKDSDNALICAVVVTYGDRWFYLKILLEHLEKQSQITSVVVIDNASQADIKAECCQAGFKKTLVFRQESNIGSAGGFSIGIKFAASLESNFIMLFDDDTMPHPETINGLLERLIEINLESKSCINAVIPSRNSQILCLEAVMNKQYYWMLEESVFGLNVFNFFQRHILNRLNKYTLNRVTEKTGTVAYGLAAYAGLMFHKNVCDKIGFPDKSFVLYYDDIEYTNRILTLGGMIWICTDLGMDDIVVNYSSEMMSRPFLGLILADNDGKVYYQVRNQLFFEYNYISRNKVAFLVNVFIYAAISFIVSVFFLKFSRIKAIQTGICHGIMGNLGVYKKYELK